MKEQIAKLESVLCTPSGLVVINGADGDRATVDEALGELRALAERPGHTPAQLAANMRAGLTTGAGQAQQALEKMVDYLVDAGRTFERLEAKPDITEQESRAYHSYRRVEAKYRAMLRELGEHRPEREPAGDTVYGAGIMRVEPLGTPCRLHVMVFERDGERCSIPVGADDVIEVGAGANVLLNGQPTGAIAKLMIGGQVIGGTENHD